jgi:hypothetical protein
LFALPVELLRQLGGGGGDLAERHGDGLPICQGLRLGFDQRGITLRSRFKRNDSISLAGIAAAHVIHRPSRRDQRDQGGNVQRAYSQHFTTSTT